MKNRTLIGIVCIVLALVLTFGGTALVNIAQTKTISVVTAANNIKKGSKIAMTDLSVAEINAGATLHNDWTFKNKKEAEGAIAQITGRYATVDILEGDMLTSKKTTNISTNIDAALEGLTGEKIAMSVPITTFAGHLSGKLQVGDVISIIFTDRDRDNIESRLPMAYQYLRIVGLTANNGLETSDIKMDDGSVPMPSTITFLLYPVQAAMLRNEMENGSRMHLALVYRGEEEAGKQLTDITEEYARALEEASKKVAENAYKSFSKNHEIQSDNKSFNDYYAKHKDEFVKIIDSIFEDIFGEHVITEANESAFAETTTAEAEVN